MKNPAEIKALAYERLEEAKILCEAGKYDGAFYLAGYSIELMLKAKVCEQVGIDNLFYFDEKGKAAYGVSEIRKAVRTHDISVLLMLSGLKVKFDEAKSDNKKLLKANGLLFENSGKCLWNEQVRYQVNLQKQDNVQNLIDLLIDDEGVLKWIETN